METYGYKIKELLRQEHIKKKDLAAGMGMSETALGKIESGKTKLKIDHIEKIAEMTGKSMSYVVGYLTDAQTQLLSDNNSLEARLQEKDIEIAGLRRELDTLKGLLKVQTELAESRLQTIRAKDQIIGYMLKTDEQPEV